jgi:hypothetical protein
MSRSSRRQFVILVLGVFYVLVVLVLVGLLWWGRQWTIGALDNAQAKSQWQTYRQAITAQVEAGAPVQRQTPRSDEPPALVLLRDHFGSCLALSLVLVTAVYFAFAFFLVGVTRPDGTAQMSNHSDH